MEQYVVIKLGKFDVQKRLQYFLQVVQENCQLGEYKGWLTLAFQMLESYYSWQSAYYPLLGYCRDVPSEQPNSYDPTEANQKFENLQASINVCFNSPEFINSWLEVDKKLEKSQKIRFIFETDNLELQRLPLQTCSLFDNYKISGIIWNNSKRDRLQKSRGIKATNRVKILTVFSDNTGLSPMKNDWDILQDRFANAELIPLIKPSLQYLQDFLYRENIDIILFTGHGPDRQDSEQDWIPINSRDRLRIDDLQDALKTSIQKRGLQLVICNFCNGLSIANKLWEIGVPEIIAMREPVLDSAARDFLDYFLDTLSNNPEQPLYSVVRQVKQRLKEQIQDYLGAAFVPVIFQDPEELPLTGQIIFGTEYYNNSISPTLSTDILSGDCEDDLLINEQVDKILWGGNKRKITKSILVADENDELLVAEQNNEEHIIPNQEFIFSHEAIFSKYLKLVEDNYQTQIDSSNNWINYEYLNQQFTQIINQIDNLSLGNELNEFEFNLESLTDKNNLFTDL
ncbi:MAG: hypothetical protein SAL07_02395 [Oscillatoria sp. PMC 1051.18]|nr:hypothetical protein [Oscillatoria sp. PMC 1050.18]MEC5028736.1 hypothetical protein [Oscillatoria sp. PMC 1051.18]